MNTKELDALIENADPAKISVAWDKAMNTYSETFQRMRLKGYEQSIAAKIASLHADATFIEEVNFK